MRDSILPHEVVKDGSEGCEGLLKQKEGTVMKAQTKQE